MIIDCEALAYTGISETLNLQLITFTCPFAYSTDQPGLHSTKPYHLQQSFRSGFGYYFWNLQKLLTSGPI